MFFRSIEAFSLNQGTGGMSLQSPISCEIVPDTQLALFAGPTPGRVKQEAWLRRRLDEIEKAATIQRVSNPRCACLIHVVHKKSYDPKQQFSLVLDMMV